MDAKLLGQALWKYALGVMVTGALLFVPANSFAYWNGWLFMGLLFIPMFLAGILMMIKNPALLKSRLEAKEKETTQKAIVLMSSLMFVAGFVIAGLDFRYQWTRVPIAVVILASVLFVIAYLLYAEVLRENTYLSRTISVQENQKVIDTGLYGIVRHPMYFSTILLFLAMPIILGSWISFGIFLVYPFLIAKRIQNEEIVLEKELEGYTAYQQKVKYKLIPYLW